MKVAVTLEQCWHRVPGGTATAAIETLRALQGERMPAAAVGAGAGIELVGVSAWHRAAPAPPFAPPIPVRALTLPRLALYESWHRWRRPDLRQVTGAVDVIHATAVAMPPRTCPVVLSLHDLAFLHEPSHFTARGLRFFRRALALARAEADLVLCPSLATMQDCRQAGFDPDRLRLVPLGVRAEPASAGAVARVRRAYGLDRYVLSVGTLEPRKNLPVLLEAFRRQGRHDLQLAVVGPQGWNESLARHVDGIGDRVRLLGFVPAPDLAALYAGAAVFCFPSLREGFGLPVLEAMAQGTPVVTSAGTSTEELATGAGLVVDPRDPDAVAGAIAAVLEDPCVAERLAVAGRERAGRYPWAATAALVAAAYREAAARC